MRKIMIAALCSLCILTGCEARPQKLSSLEEFSKPYVRFYECTRLVLAGEDAMPEGLFLELSYGGEFTLSYRTGAQEGEWTGVYSVDPTRDEITMSAMVGSKTCSRTYPMQDGKILIEENFAGRSLFAEFRFA